jgi:hypothetical protein
MLSKVSPFRGIRSLGRFAGIAGSKVALEGGRRLWTLWAGAAVPIPLAPPHGGLEGDAGRGRVDVRLLLCLCGLGEGGGCMA